MKTCPICNDASTVHRSHSYGFWEKSIFPLFRLKPLRCSKCRNRFYRFVFGTVPPVSSVSDKKKKFSVFLESGDQEDFRQLQARLREKEKLLDSGTDESQETEQIPVHEKWKVVGG